MVLTVYIHVIDGTDVYVPCEAEQLPDSTFKILTIESFDIDDDTCIWSFFPNDTVECTERILEYGQSHMVVTKLLGYDHPKRMIYQFVYDIISGSYSADSSLSIDELEILFDKKFTYGKKYPAMQKWLKSNSKY